MPSIIILDLMLTGTLLLLGIGFIRFQISNHVWLKAHGTHVSGLITQVRRDGAQVCLVTAAWTDPRTGFRCTFQGFRLDMGYQAGQLVDILLDVRHPSHYMM